MLGKLVKHEFRATGRVALPLCGVMLALSVLAGFAVRRIDGHEIFGWLDVMSLILAIAFCISLFAVSVVVFVTLIQRYRRSMLGDEGYLTMTLPVSTHALLCSRLLTALAWQVIVAAVSVLACVIAGFVFGGAQISFREALQFLSKVLHYPGMARAAAVMAVDALLGAVFLLLLCYADFTLEHSFRKHKILYNVIAVVVVLLALRLFGVLNTQIFLRTAPSSLGVIGGADGPTGIFVSGPTLPISMLELLLADVGLYFLTYWFLRRRLNLE